MMLRKLTICFLSLTCSLLVAQDNVSLLSNWDYRRQVGDTEKIHQAIATSNGFIVAVGETISESYQDLDGLIVVLDAFTGEPRSWKRLGGVGDQSLAAAVQNMDGTFTLVGNSKREEKESAAWILKIDLDGEILDEERMQNMTGSKLSRIAVNDEGTALAPRHRHQGWTRKALDSSNWCTAVRNRCAGEQPFE